MCAPKFSCTRWEAANPVAEVSINWLRENSTVRVKAFAEIQPTLDSQGRTDGLPFMPEMVHFCGKDLRIHSLADRVCLGGFRKIEGQCHLENARCSGEAHGRCQAACLLFWHMSWLEPAFSSDSNLGTEAVPSSTGVDSLPCFDPTTRRYWCQLTEVPKLGVPVPVPRMRDYLRSYCSGQLSNSHLKFLGVWLFNRVLMALFRRVRRYAPKAHPTRREFDIGDLVRVRSRSAILWTLDRRNRDKGLKVTADMLRYCGKTFRIKSRVDRIVDEYSGRLKILKNDCYILDGATCAGGGQLCSREEMYYWRGIWLKKLDHSDEP